MYLILEFVISKIYNKMLNWYFVICLLGLKQSSTTTLYGILSQWSINVSFLSLLDYLTSDISLFNYESVCQIYWVFVLIYLFHTGSFHLVFIITSNFETSAYLFKEFEIILLFLMAAVFRTPYIHISVKLRYFSLGWFNSHSKSYLVFAFLILFEELNYFWGEFFLKVNDFW